MKRAPGTYPGLPMQAYLETHAVSASILHTLDERCPRAAWFDSWLNPKRVIDLSNRAQSAGTIAHGILLEGSIENVAVIDPNEYPTKTTGNIPDGWTNKDIRAARDQAFADGKTPILLPQFRMVEAMVEEALRYIDSLRESEPAIWALFQPGGGESELTMVCEEDGASYRIRPDRIAMDRRLIVDYKTVTRTAEPAAFGRTQIPSMGYHMGAAFYRGVVDTLCGAAPTYIFFVQEQEAPHLCSLVGLEPAYIQHAEHKVATAKSLWNSCVRTGQWHGYPNRVAYAELPPWEAARFQEREAVRGNAYDYPAMGWQKPKPELLGFADEHSPAV